MSSSGTWWQRTLVYLGLKEEPEEGFGTPSDDVGAPPEEQLESEPPVAARRGDVTVRPLRPAPAPDGAERAPAVRAAVVEIRSFDDVESVGARYRTGQAVLFDASGTDAAAARRVLDFVSGMTYVSRGSLTKVGGRAFLLVPDGMQVPEDERRRLAGLGYRLTTGSNA